MKNIKIQGARTHNLKNLNITLPRNKLIVITGPSGSGKSSLALNTIYAEGQRRYVESLSIYARQFLSLLEKPDVDFIDGLSPSIAIKQKNYSSNPRSTVGTVTEIYDYLKLLFARIGIPYCPVHKIPLKNQSIKEIIQEIFLLPNKTECMILVPIVYKKEKKYKKILENFYTQGYIRARINGEIIRLDNIPKLEHSQKHKIEIVVDRFFIDKSFSKERLFESFEKAFSLTKDKFVIFLSFLWENSILKLKEKIFSNNLFCHICNFRAKQLEPREFSFNNPSGFCPSCNGLGKKYYINIKNLIPNDNLSISEGAIKFWDKKNSLHYQELKSLSKHYNFSLKKPFVNLAEKYKKIILHGSGNTEIIFSYKMQGGSFQKKGIFTGVLISLENKYKKMLSKNKELSKIIDIMTCQDCLGSRIKELSRNIYIDNMNIPKLIKLSIKNLLIFFKKIKINFFQRKISERILNDIIRRLDYLLNVGLEYLSLDRETNTLSGGEKQRIRLAGQIGSGLTGIIYIIDEPTIGLHQRDNKKLLESILHLRDIGNTVIVIEHDKEIMLQADYIIDIGPSAGINGGEILAQGNLQSILSNIKSITGQYLSGKKKIQTPKNRKKYNKKKELILFGCQENNLKNIDIYLPIGLITCITGVSGSGKSTLINDTLYPLVSKIIMGKIKKNYSKKYKKITGIDFLDKVISINQNLIGRTPRSNPSTYMGIFDIIRKLFSSVEDSRIKGYKSSRFSFNIKGGRCEMCKGDGLIKVEMQFLSDIYVTCNLCKGKRYNEETLKILYKKKNISQILNLTIKEAYYLFRNIPTISKKLKALLNVGLGYIKLGQSSTTLSGGESQRIKLAKELSKKNTGKTLYILDEPSVGLHFLDIEKLLLLLYNLRKKDNTIIIIEHNLDIIKSADWIIDMGPEGGKNGGKIISVGTPEEISKCNYSYTGKFLSNLL